MEGKLWGEIYFLEFKQNTYGKRRIYLADGTI